MKHSFQWIRENLTGLSTPLFGVAWQPSTSEKEAIRKLFIYLDDRRALHVDEKGTAPRSHSHRASPDWLAASILDIRKTITSTLQLTNFPKEVKDVLSGMQEACRDQLERPAGFIMSDRMTLADVPHLKMFHHSIATGAARLAVAYELDLGTNLSRLASSAL